MYALEIGLKRVSLNREVIRLVVLPSSLVVVSYDTLYPRSFALGAL